MQRCLSLALAAAVMAGGLIAQESGAPRPAEAPKGRGPGGINAANPVPALEESGFQALSDGQTLKGWDFDPNVWRVEGGVIVGETTPEKAIKQNTFLIWSGGKPGDFELKFEYRLTGGNTGVQYRSVEVPGVKWGLKGYQGDIDAQQRYTGQIYEERGRGFLALRGQAAYVGAGKKSGMVGALGSGEELKALLKDGDWNAFHVIARGNTIVQIVNGRVMSLLVDDDVANRMIEGLIGFQVHTGPPMKLELRNVRLKTY
ncbi:MAG: DUF1080 domain-containing protein [Bryobacteraceae bacterium]|nr:DUF1080 domain-containing protein [Bryobacteraceae bacterium]